MVLLKQKFVFLIVTQTMQVVQDIYTTRH